MAQETMVTVQASATTAPISVVTGGAGLAIGGGISLALARAGHRVIVGDVDPGAAQETADLLRGRGLLADAVELDVSDAAAVDAAFAEVVARYGRVDGLVCSAGVGLTRALASATEDEVARLMGINLFGPWRCMAAVIPQMQAQGGGSIVTIGSVHHAGAEAGNSFYSASKAGLAALTRGAARDYGADGIRCNTVHPGAVQGTGRGPAELYDEFVHTRQMLPTHLEGVDVGNVVAFLLSDAARGVTGTELHVDAGTAAMLFDQARVAPDDH